MNAAELDEQATITLRVYGVPQPQGSKSAFRTGRHTVVVEGGSPAARERFHSWRDAVARAGRDWQDEHGGVGLADGPLHVEIAFLLPRPKSAPKKRRYPTGRPDVDKCARAVLDALTGVVWRDDAQVVRLGVAKTYAVTNEPPGCIIIIKAAA